MYTLGIPNRQYRRTTQVLGHEAAEPIEYESTKQDDGFYMFTFPEADEYDFKEIVHLLKINGITTIGADNQLTENSIMKLSELINEQENLEENVIIDILKDVLERWERPDYKGGIEKCERSDHYFEDIRELIEDQEENFYLDLEDPSDVGEEINESKYKLKDFFSNEQINPAGMTSNFLTEQMSPETLMVKLGGDEKTELKISNQTDSNGSVDLSNVTLEFKNEKYEGLEFKLEDILEDHGNEGKDALFVAESDDKTFEVEVNIDANYDQSGIIEDVEWRSL